MRIKRIDGGWALVYEVRTETGEPLRVLRIGGAYQSATYLRDRWCEPPFAYYRAFDKMFDACRPDARNADGQGGAVGERSFDISSVLVIGGGGCSYPKHLLADRDGVRVDVVERDRRIASIARRFFFVDRLEEELLSRGESDRFRLIVADGLDYLRSCTKPYDAIVNDAFVGKTPVGDLMEPAALSLAKRRLSSGGIYLANLVVGDELAELDYFQGAVNALKGAFAHVHAVAATDAGLSDKDNYIVLATDGDYSFEGALEV